MVAAVRDDSMGTAQSEIRTENLSIARVKTEAGVRIWVSLIENEDEDGECVSGLVLADLSLDELRTLLEG